MSNKNQTVLAEPPDSRKRYCKPSLTKEKNFSLVTGISIPPFDGRLNQASHGREA